MSVGWCDSPREDSPREGCRTTPPAAQAVVKPRIPFLETIAPLSYLQTIQFSYLKCIISLFLVYSGGVYFSAPLILILFSYLTNSPTLSSLPKGSPTQSFPRSPWQSPIGRPLLDISYKWNGQIHGLLCLAAFTMHNAFQVPPRFSMYQFLIPFRWLNIIPFMDGPHSVYPVLGVCTGLWLCFSRYIPMRGIAESCDNSMFTFLKTRQTFKTLDSVCASCVGQDSRMGLLFARDDIKIACKIKAVV